MLYPPSKRIPQLIAFFLLAWAPHSREAWGGACDYADIRNALTSEPKIAEVAGDPERLKRRTEERASFRDLIATLEATGADKLFSETECRKILDLTYLYFLKADPHVVSGGAGFADSLLDRALEYRRENADAFRTSVEKFGVDPAVILSLILVESRMGKSPGRYSLVSVLLTMGASDREDVWKFLTDESLKKDPTRDREALMARFREKTPKKNIWAAAEVQAVLRLRSKWPEVLKLKTSYAGAFGIPQFLPSSYERYAVTPSTDPNHAPDLYAPEDVVYSVGNYLHSFGWNATSTIEEKRAAVYGYNHSQSYVDLVLDTAQKLELRNIPFRLAAARASGRAAAANEDGATPKSRRTAKRAAAKRAADAARKSRSNAKRDSKSAGVAKKADGQSKAVTDAEKKAAASDYTDEESE